MPQAHDPAFFEALQQIFVTRDELKNIVDYQQRLYASLQELNNNHRVFHEHVRDLTHAHNTVREDTNALLQSRKELSKAIEALADAHQKTHDEIQSSIAAIDNIQQAVDKIPELENRLDELEQQ